MPLEIANQLGSQEILSAPSIYGIEESAGMRFIVLELVEGETLADVLKRGPVSTEEALKLGLQLLAGVSAVLANENTQPHSRRGLREL
jgi:serine/threonine protein kinase